MGDADIGLIGLAVMGQNLVLNMDDHGFKVAVFNRTLSKVDDFLQGAGKGTRITGAHSIGELVSALRRPRLVMLMVRAGPAVDDFIEQLIPLLAPGDVIIDGGNSNYCDSIRRATYVESKGLLFVGTGVSGGEEGARHGPSIMPGGSPAAWPLVRPIFQAIAAKVKRRGGRRGSLLRLGGRERGRALRQNGPQWDRIRGYAADLRGVSSDARGVGDERRRHSRRDGGMEPGQTEFLPD